MTIIHGTSKAVQEIARALNLPRHTKGFTLRMRAGEIATLEVETYVEADGTKELVKALKRYRLEELEEPEDQFKPPPMNETDPREL